MSIQITMGHIKATEPHLGIIRHILAYSGIIKDIQELFRHIQGYSGPCEIMV